MPRVTHSRGESRDLQLGSAASGAPPYCYPTLPLHLGRSAPFTHLPLLTESSQRFIGIICTGHCEIRKSSIWANSDPAYWVRQGPESQALVPLAGGTEPGAAAHHRPCDGETCQQSWSGKNQWCPNSSILGWLDNPLPHLEL